MLRLADVLAGLSVVTDLGMGHPPEQAMRACRIAMKLAEDLDLPDGQRSDIFYTALLQHLGCVGYAHETALLWGDDLALNAAGSKTDFFDPRDVLRTFLPELASGRLARVRLGAIAFVRGSAFGRANNTANCEAARVTARRMGLSPGVQEALYQSFELWNGKGVPRGLAGEDILPAARVAQVAGDAALFADLGGTDAVAVALRARAGAKLDPGMCERLARLAPSLAPLLEEDPIQAALAAEPEPRVTVGLERLDEVARAFGDLVDLKTPFTHGHAHGVAVLAGRAGEALGVEDPPGLRRAALLHDVGRAAVSTGTWERAGALGTVEWEQVRLHPYHTERVLARSEALAPLAPIAGMHHERLDGSGYHRGAARSAVPMAARVLAAADALQAMTQDRPHRAAAAPEQAAEELGREAERGRLDPDAVAAVVGAADPGARRVRRRWPAGLSERQVEVLRLVARGLSNRQIAQELFISPRTAEHHVQDVYAKIGVSSRAAAALFAMEHDLLA